MAVLSTIKQELAGWFLQCHFVSAWGFGFSFLYPRIIAGVESEATEFNLLDPWVLSCVWAFRIGFMNCYAITCLALMLPIPEILFMASSSCDFLWSCCHLFMPRVILELTLEENIFPTRPVSQINYWIAQNLNSSSPGNKQVGSCSHKM